MKNILEGIRRPHDASAKISDLSYHLECCVGCYYVGLGYIPYEAIFEIYYDGAIDKDEESVDLVPENLVAYATADGKYAFVLERMFDKFVADTAQFSFQYVPVTDFHAREFYIDLAGEVPELFRKITWIDDSFLYDENVTFDFEAYFKIDDGVHYLNPKRFSIDELMTLLWETFGYLKRYR